MIILDIETSGIYLETHGIWQIGALDFYNPQNTFLEEARIDDEDEIEPSALKVTGTTESYLRNSNKQSQKKLIENFFKWAGTVKIKNPVCQNPQFDVGFINYKARKYNVQSNLSDLDKFTPFYHHSFDLHSIAQTRYEQINSKLLIEENQSKMRLSKILEFCGLEDKRIKMKDGEVEKEGSPHNALEDAKLIAECFSRIICGKQLLKEFSKYKIPEYLRRN